MQAMQGGQTGQKRQTGVQAMITPAHLIPCQTEHPSAVTSFVDFP